MRFILTADIPGKKNTFRVYRGRGVQIKSKELEAIAWELAAQRNKKKSYEFPFKEIITCDIWIQGDDRKDLINQMGTVCDLLQESGIIQNDRQIKYVRGAKHIGKPNICKIIIMTSKMLDDDWDKKQREFKKSCDQYHKNKEDKLTKIPISELALAETPSVAAALL